MSGYLGDGYGQYRDHGDDDFREEMRDRDQTRDRRERQGSPAFFRGQDEDRVAYSARANQAAVDWRRRYGREGHEGSYDQHDETYRQYRDRHVQELDRDYDEWCREREQSFHRDFDDWRNRRRGATGTGRQPGEPMTNDPGDSSTLAEDRQADALVAAQDEGGKRSRRKR